MAAKSLLAIVRERFPKTAPRLAEIKLDLCVLDGWLDGLVGPLRNPALTDGERQRIHDLPALGTVPSLPPEHPLRIAACTALTTALQAVTEGPSNDDLLTLPQVARRSPLTSWKALVRAIARHHRHEDVECRNWLPAGPCARMQDGPLTTFASRAGLLLGVGMLIRSELLAFHGPDCAARPKFERELLFHMLKAMSVLTDDETDGH